MYVCVCVCVRLLLRLYIYIHTFISVKDIFVFLILFLESKEEKQMSQSTYSAAKLDELVMGAKDYCLLHGLVMFDKECIQNENEMQKNSRVFHLPFTLMPSTYPRHELDFAFDLQTKFNELIFSLSNDFEFLKETFKK